MSSQSNTSASRMDWIIFLISFAVCVFLLLTSPQWFWVPLPFVITYLVKGLNMM